MHRSTRTFSIFLAFALIAALNVLWLYLSPSTALTEENQTVKGTWNGIPFVVLSPAPVAPAFTSSPLVTGTAGVTYTYAISVTGSPTPTLYLDYGPEGMTLDASGRLQWMPEEEGSFAVRVRASNGTEPDAVDEFWIEVVCHFYWDPRLDERGAVLVEADVPPGGLYWRLHRAHWLNEQESAGRHHIFVDTLDENRVRMSGVPILVSWDDGSAAIVTQEKPGEPYAADFAMYALAPAYNAAPIAGYPADRVDGMGLGEIDAPYNAHHTSYHLTWILSVKEASADEPDGSNDSTPPPLDVPGME